jgi:precorrin-6A synthase
MLSGSIDLAGLEDWPIWWGANLGTASERLVSGTVSEVAAQIDDARAGARSDSGWVMDVYLLRRPS